MSNQDTSVRVAVRIRPILGKEKVEGCMECVRPTSRTELVMEGKEKRFTFDNVFGKESQQADIYHTNVSPLVKSLFDGYNATVLAYGQTGSGKTYTMGTSTECLLEGYEENLGVVPRAMEEIFELIEQKKESNPGAEFYLRVQFLEVYGEDIRDLLDPSAAAEGKTVVIRDGGKGESVSIEGAREETVKSTEEMLGTLERGAMCRTTGSTQMNFHSSRSHAIFTIIIEQHLPTAGSLSLDEDKKSETEIEQQDKERVDTEEKPSGEEEAQENQVLGETAESVEYRTAKFHFVDLAGSERAKRTGATGTRLKEGININKGLLALGNVISALGDETKQVTHVPYRDSKLTRMLQDSLGGNSRTLMIACVSPADANIEETLNALRYANRARNIKNKPVINRDPNSSQIAFLKAQISQLRAQLGGANPGALDAFSFGNGPALGNYSRSTVDPALEEEIATANQRAADAESEVIRLQAVVEREKRQRSEMQEKLVMSNAQVDYYIQREEDAGRDPEDPEIRNSVIEANAKYLRRIEELERQLAENDSELTRARRQLSEFQSDANIEENMDDLDLELLRNAKIRKELEFVEQDKDSLEVSPYNEDEQNEEKNEPGDVASPEILDDSTFEVTEEDDAITRDLKVRFHKTQLEYKQMVDSYDVTLRTKKLYMQKIVEERKKYDAMKAHYEAKMAEMNAEVQSTQQSRDELDSKIKSLEGAASSDATKSQLAKLRAELKVKNERLKALELQTKQLKDSKRMAKSWELKEQKVQREIDQMKQQKVASQRKMEENAKKYREESQKRKMEIARLRKETRSLAGDKQKLLHKNNRDERLLKQKSEQVAAMQRKLRNAQRFTAHNSALTEKEKKQRIQLEKYAIEKIKKDEELLKLQRSMAKKNAAIEKKEKLCRQMEECMRAAEARAKAAEEETERARSKASIETLFPAGSGKLREGGSSRTKVSVELTAEERETFEDLKDRLEAAEFEISFQEKKVIEAAANISDDEGDHDTAEEGEESSSSPAADKKKSFGKAKADFEESLLNFESIEDAKERLAGLLTMWLEAKQDKIQLQKTIDALNSAKDSRRKSLLGSPSTGFRQSSSSSLTRATLLASGGSPARSPSAPGGSSASFQERATENELMQLREANQRLVAMLQEKGVDVSSQNMQLRALEEHLRDIAVQPRNESNSRRSSLASLRTPSQHRSSLGTDHAETPPSPANSGLRGNGEDSNLISTGGKSPGKNQRNVFNRLTDYKSYTGTARARLYAGPTDSKALRKALNADTHFEEETLDEFNAELPIDEFTYHPTLLGTIRDEQSPKASDPVGRISGGSASSPSFTRPTEAWQSKQRSSKQRESSGSSTSATGGSSKPAFCSTAGPAKSIGKAYPALTESAILQTDQGTYRATEGGLYRNNGGKNSPVPGPSVRQAARSRMGAWQAPNKQQMSSLSADNLSPKLTEIDNADANGRQQSAFYKVEDSEKEKENTETEDSPPQQTAIPIHEKLSDPKFYTGTQKHRAGITISSTSNVVPASLKLSMAQERARRKGKVAPVVKP